MCTVFVSERKTKSLKRVGKAWYGWVEVHQLGGIFTVVQFQVPKRQMLAFIYTLSNNNTGISRKVFI